MAREKKRAIYPGTFDPVTNGHMDIIQRSSGLFDHVIVGVTTNPSKTPLFSAEARIKMIQDEVSMIENVDVRGFDGLLMDYARKNNAHVVVRGLRAITDFEFELQMALMNRKLADEIVTVFLMPNEKYTYLNSTIVKEVAKFEGDISSFVSPAVEKLLVRKFKSA